MQQKIPSIPTSNLYRKKLNGFRCSHRNRWLLLCTGILSQRALLLFEFYLDVFDFDYRHDTFGQFQVDYSQIAQVFQTSENTIRSWHKELVDKKFIRFTRSKLIYEIANPKRYLNSGFWLGEAASFSKSERNKNIETVLQNSTNNFQSTRENIQGFVGFSTTDQVDDPSITLGSSKYQSNGASLSEDDMTWISEHAKENV